MWIIKQEHQHYNNKWNNWLLTLYLIYVNYLKMINECGIKWCRILGSLVTIITTTTKIAITIISDETIAILTIQSTVMITNQRQLKKKKKLVLIPIIRYTTTPTRNSMITPGDDYKICNG